MPSPKDGTPGTLVPPAAPDEAHDADKADPGEVEQIKSEQQQKKTGKYGSAPCTPYKKPETEEEIAKKKHWVAIVLKDEDKKPVPGAKYRITLPDGTTAEGTLDASGKARVNGIDPGDCQITFPDLHPDIWHPG